MVNESAANTFSSVTITNKVATREIHAIKVDTAVISIGVFRNFHPPYFEIGPNGSTCSKLPAKLEGFGVGSEFLSIAV
jgi:hypothetical protein